MKIGLQIPSLTWPGGAPTLGADLAEVARTADAAGFEWIAVMDHFFQIHSVGAPEEPMVEGYTTLGYLAGLTSRAKLLTLVTGNVYRHPGVLAKQVTTLDVLSGGRAWLGIGAGWFEGEALGLGIPFPPMKERFERLEEALQIMHRMFSDSEEPYQGKYYQLQRPLNSPAPLTKPHPPIMIGGSGETKTLRFVAKYADACNIFPTPELPHKLEVLREHCEREGRDYDSIMKTVIMPMSIGADGSGVDELLAQLEQWAALGVQGLLGMVADAHTIRPLEVIGSQVIPAAAAL